MSHCDGDLVSLIRKYYVKIKGTAMAFYAPDLVVIGKLVFSHVQIP